MKDKSDIQSQTISFLRFPMVVGIVLLHSKLSTITMGGVDMLTLHDFTLYEYISCYFSRIFCSIFVPLYFIISGFLYFYKIEDFNHNTYLNKTKRRLRSLVLPYFLWNAIYVVLQLLSVLLVPALLSGAHKSVLDYTLTDYLWSFWDCSKIDAISMAMPINGPLWFMRDLIVVAFVFAPLLYWLMSKSALLTLVLVSALHLLDLSLPVAGINFSALFYFTLGALWATSKRNIINVNKCYGGGGNFGLPYPISVGIAFVPR